jgi:hypothetical protein
MSARTVISSAATTPAWLASFIGQRVVVDLDEHYLVIGTLTAASADHLALSEADLHDHHEANSTKEVYTMESATIGVRANRRAVAVPLARVIAISLLEDASVRSPGC